jgi:hypothetical protein
MGQMNLIPFLGDEFYRYMPLLILFPILFTYFDVVEKTLRFFGLSRYGWQSEERDQQTYRIGLGARMDEDPEEEEQGRAVNGQIEEGRRLIDEVRKVMERKAIMGSLGERAPLQRSPSEGFDAASTADPINVGYFRQQDNNGADYLSSSVAATPVPLDWMCDVCRFPCAPATSPSTNPRVGRPEHQEPPACLPRRRRRFPHRRATLALLA